MAKNPDAIKPIKIRHPKAEVSFMHNFLPPLVGLLVTVFVFAALNSQWIAAEWRYKYHAPKAAAAVIVPKNDDQTKIPMGPTRLTIGKIAVDAPVITDMTSTAEYKVQLALRTGVVRYGNSALPGENGNMVIVGHSSGQLWAPGDYKFVFTLLNKVQKDDLIQIDYKGTRYTYKITGTKIVTPQDLTILGNTPDPTLTLVTCSPVGTSNKRFVVTAKQISPSPVKNVPEVRDAGSGTHNKELPGNTPSLWRQIKDSL